jgi:hypothetical protein
VPCCCCCCNGKCGLRWCTRLHAARDIPPLLLLLLLLLLLGLRPAAALYPSLSC